jgi:arylsulfatase A-like enzyme
MYRSIASVFSFPFFLLAGGFASAASKPNILIIVGDDMGYSDVGVHGCKDIPTPNMDAIANSGVRFTNGYVSGPYCSPTRAGLLTGRYQTRFGHEFNPTGDNGMPTSEETLADRLKANGYKTGLVGKWHLGSQDSMHPQSRGFEEFYGFLPGAHDYFKAGGILRGKKEVGEIEHTTDDFGREAAAFIDRHNGLPWFLYLSFNAVHTPMQATDDRLAKFSNEEDKTRRIYDAMMLAMDEAIGVVRDKLASTKQLDNTLIMFISDNGGPTMVGVTVNGSRNAPLRGSKRTTLEGGIRVPFFVAWPTEIKPGIYDKPVIQLDLHATALAASGLDVTRYANLEGVDLVPFIAGKKTEPPHESLYWRFGKQMAIRSSDWKLVQYDLNVEQQSTRGKDVSSARLYNLAADIHEDHDLSNQQPEKVKELQAKWDAWDKSNVSPLWGNSGSDEDREGGRKKKKKAAE